MARSEFRWNKKRKHYAYLFKDDGCKCKNILISSKPVMIEKKNRSKKRVTPNIPLFHHPNHKKEGRFYIIPIIYCDYFSSFDDKRYNGWCFDKNDKRMIKRLKKRIRYKKSQLEAHQL